MKIMDFLSQDAIIIDLKATDKKSAIVELAEVLKNTKKIKDTDDIINIVLEREKLGSTGIGQRPKWRCLSGAKYAQYRHYSRRA